MKKNEKYTIAISLDTVSTAYLEAESIRNFDNNPSISSIFQGLVKKQFDDIVETEAYHTCLLSTEFDSLPGSLDFSVWFDKESLELLDCLVDESGISRSGVIRWLLTREFG